MNLIIKILAMMFTVISIIAVLFVAAVGGLMYAVGGLMYAVLWLVGALSVLTVSVYQWWVKLLTDVKGLGSAESD